MTSGQGSAHGGVQERAREGGQGPRGPMLRETRPPYQRYSGAVAAVLLYENGGHSVIWPHTREDHRKPWLRAPYTVFEIALGRNVTRFDLELPARGDSEFFRARASVHWKVEEPVEVVRNQVWDVADLLRDELLDRLREVSRRFRLTEAQRADEAVRAELDSGRSDLGRDLGLSTRVHVFIDLSTRVMEQVREGAVLDHRLELAEKEHALHRRKEQHESQLVLERARSFEAVLQGGDEARIAHFMARDPARALDIEKLFAHERRQGQADWLEFIGKLIDGGQLERHDIGEHMYEVLEHLRDRSSGVVGGTMGMAFPEARHRPPEALESGPGKRRPFWEEDEGDPAVREPTRVESSEEIAERAHPAGEFGPEPFAPEAAGRETFEPGAPGPAPRSRASDRFDDWGDS